MNILTTPSVQLMRSLRHSSSKIFSTVYVFTFDVRRTEAKCVVVMAVCLSVCLSLAAFPQYCTDPDITWAMVRSALYLFAIGQI